MTLDSDRLQKACNKVIDALNEFEPEYKIAALKMLIDSFPKDYIMVESRKKCTCKEGFKPVHYTYVDRHSRTIKWCSRCGGEL